MALDKLKIPPQSPGYAAKPGPSAAEAQGEGGTLRQRTIVIGAWERVPVSWSVGPSGYEYLRAFYALNGARGLPFLADLIVESANPAERTCRFVAGSFGLKGQSGLTYEVAAELAVEPIIASDADLRAIVDGFTTPDAPPLADGGTFDGVLS